MDKENNKPGVTSTLDLLPGERMIATIPITGISEHRKPGSNGSGVTKPEIMAEWMRRTSNYESVRLVPVSEDELAIVVKEK